MSKIITRTNNTNFKRVPYNTQYVNDTDVSYDTLPKPFKSECVN